MMRASAPTGLEDTACDDAFLTLAWFENFAAHGIADVAKLLLLQVRLRSTGDNFCLPMMRRRAAPAAAFGTGLASFSNFYSSLYGPVGDPALCTLAACRALVRELRRLGHVVDLQPLDVSSAFFANLQLALEAEGWWHDRYFCFGNWHLQVAGRSFDTYAATLPSRLRNTIRRGQKKLDATGDWSLSIFDSPGVELEQGITDWQTIYDKSWKVPEPFPRFVPELCRMAAHQGWLRLGIVRVHGVPVAAQIWLLRQGRAQIFKLAYDEEFKRYSAGSVLSAEMMRRAIDVDGVFDVDYLTGDDAYKADWMSHRRERMGLVAFDPMSLQGLASAGKHFGGRWLRRWRKREQLVPAPPPEETAT
jgi:CelD/BcsL family acetyltransferase involved in cellulose biosynthesis